MTNYEKRNERAAEIVAGLRDLADLIVANPELAEIFPTGNVNLSRHLFADAAETMAWFARIAARAGLKVEKDYSDNGYASVEARVNGLVSMYVQTDRAEVCTRVVTGTETVTKKVKDPAALAAVPEVEVTEEVETYEWQCRPLLAAEGGA